MANYRADVDACVFVRKGNVIDAVPSDDGTLEIKSAKLYVDAGDFTAEGGHPEPVFTVSPLQINAGDQAVLAWSCHGASGIYLDGKGVTGPANTQIVKPTVTTEYVLRVTYTGEPDVILKVTVTVKTSTGWEAAYWNNVTFAGEPALVTTAPEINFDWGTGTPSPLISVDRWSARYTRTLQFKDAVYEFSVTSDDGSRLYVDNSLLIDNWKDQPATTKTATKRMSAGSHVIKIEYYENGGLASFKFALRETATPPSVDYKRTIGINFLGSRARAQEMIDNGLRDAVFIDDIDGCKWFCDLLGKTHAFDGRGTVMFRRYINFWPSSPQQAFELCRGAEEPRAVKIITNESEFLGEGNSPEGILKHAYLDVETIKLCAQAGSHAAAGTFAVGNPDITSKRVRDALRTGYADWWNNFYAQTGFRPVWDQHEYSPYLNHIYNTWEGDVPFDDGASVMAANNIKVGYFGRNNVRVASIEPLAPLHAAVAGSTKVVHVYEQDWHETRVKFLFALCGFKLNSGGVLLSSETGVDMGGRGGFPGVGATDDEITRWMRKFREIFLRPVTDEYGTTGVMPKVSSNIFQGTDESHAQGRWGSYYVGNRIPAMSPVWLESR